jgi:hypothetical protein
MPLASENFQIWLSRRVPCDHIALQELTNLYYNIYSIFKYERHHSRVTNRNRPNGKDGRSIKARSQSLVLSSRAVAFKPERTASRPERQHVAPTLPVVHRCD